MADSAYQRLQELFVAAMDQPASARAAFVASACGDDAALRERVLALLARATEDDTFLLDPLPVVALAGTTAKAAFGLDAGDRIGPYELLRLLGEGGFGAVWEARQLEPVARHVALKVLKLGMDSEQVVARFAQERQALACLDHPGIARVLDAGVTAVGRPYFVMELVDGQPLVEFCDAGRLSIEARLQVFAQVCDAVQHAHGRGIIHRDLKPSNVLVVVHDGVPHAKVIDFGIAKAVGRKLTERTLQTEASQVIGTLEYMSPEQAGGSLDIDIRTDVWSLGVILYELLTGRTPFAPSEPVADWRLELQRRLQQTDPARPSTELARAGERLAALASQRRTTGQRLGARVRGELDWIVLKALERDRARRYATAHELAADVRAHLAGEPIAAAPPGAGYRLRKFVRRNRALVAASAAVVAALATGLVLFAWQAGVARSERDRALTAQAQSEQVQQLVIEALGSADPVDGGSQGALVVDAMTRAGAMLDAGRLRDQAEVELGLRLTISGVLLNNGAPAAGLHHAERAMALARGLFVGDHERLLSAHNHLARALRDSGRSADEEPVRREALAIARRLWPDGHSLLVQTMQQYATCLLDNGRMGEGEALLLDAATMAERVFPGDHWVAAGLWSQLGHSHYVAGRAEAAEPLFAAAVAMASRLQPEGHPRTARFLANRAMALVQLRRLGEAEVALRTALAMTERAFAGDHPDLLTRRSQLGQVLRDLGRGDAAVVEFAGALAMARRLFAGDHPRTADCLEQLGDLRVQRGEADGVVLLAEALAMRRRLHPGDHPDVAHVLAAHAKAQGKNGDPAAIEAALLEALAMTRRLHPGDHADVRARLRDLGFHHWSTREHDAAAREFGEALAMARRLRPGDSMTVVELLDDYGSARLGEGELGDALAAFDEARTMLQRLPGHSTAEVARLLRRSVQALLGQGAPADVAVHATAEAAAAERDAALRIRLDALAAVARGGDHADPKGLVRAQRMAAAALFQGGRPQMATELLTEAVAFARRQWPRGDLVTAAALEDLGVVASRRGDQAAAATAFAAALEVAQAVAPTDAALLQRLQTSRDAAQQATK